MAVSFIDRYYRSQCSLLYHRVLVYLFGRGGLRGHERMVVGFITTYAINAYRHKHREFEPH
jgi:hypothetical protein